MKTLELTLTTRQGLIAQGVSVRQTQILLDGKYANVYDQTIANLAPSLGMSAEEFKSLVQQIAKSENASIVSEEMIEKSNQLEEVKRSEEVKAKEIKRPRALNPLDNSKDLELIEELWDENSIVTITKNGVTFKKAVSESKNEALITYYDLIEKEGKVSGSVYFHNLKNTQPEGFAYKASLKLPYLKNIAIEDFKKVVKKNGGKLK